MGIQDQFVKLTLIIYWVVCLPLAYLLAFPLKVGYAGLWYGMGIDPNSFPNNNRIHVQIML